MPITKVCKHCKTEFSVTPKLSKARRYCSPKCRAAASRINLTCEGCSKSFWTWKSQITPHRPGKFCSRSCADKAKIREKPEKVKVVREPVFKICETCGKTFRVPPVRKDTARFCSSFCKNTNTDFKREASEKQQGEKSWRWSGGKYSGNGTDGYVRVKRNHRGKEIKIMEHRSIMLQWMIEKEPDHPFLVVVDGHTRLHPDIEVHHVDRDRANNARKNLLAVTKSAHAQIHHRGKKPESWECWPRNPAKW